MSIFEDFVERYNLQDKRNLFASIASGALFSIAWWIIIDVASCYPDQDAFTHAYHVCGVMGTISMIMINMVSNGQIRGESYTEGCLGQRGARGWFFLGLVLGFTSLIASSWILFQAYVIPAKDPQWPGVGLFLQNLFIFFSSLLLRFGRSEDNWS